MSCRRSCFRLIAACCLAWSGLTGSVSAADSIESPDKFPSRPITITVTFPPGGGTDILARLIGNYLGETTGHASVVENKPGASGNLGAKFVAERAPDGYSLLMVNSSFAINPAVFAQMPFDPKKDFAPIINVAFVPSVLVVPASSPYQTLAELITAAKPDKNDVSYGSCGNGTPQHLAGESLNIYAGTHITHIPFGGCGPALNSVLGGQIPMAIITASSASNQIKAGKLRALAVTSPKRSPFLPDVPTSPNWATQATSSTSGTACWHPLAPRPPCSKSCLRESTRSCKSPRSGKSLPRSATHRLRMAPKPSRKSSMMTSTSFPSSPNRSA